METQQIELGENGIITVFLGKGIKPNSEYSHHPQVAFVECDSIENPDREKLAKLIAPTTKAVLLTEGIVHSIYHSITAEARQRHLVYAHRSNGKSVFQLLSNLLPKGPDPVGGNGSGHKQIAPKGAIQQLIQSAITENKINLRDSTADIARILQREARQKGIVTTFGSLTQAVSNYKRKQNAGDIPLSARPRDKRLEAVRVLDDAIAGLTLIRDFVEQTGIENKELTEKLEKVRKSLALEE